MKTLNLSQNRFLKTLKVGDRVQGSVIKFTKHGAIVKIGPISGLLHIKNMSWGTTDEPEEKVKLRQKLELVIIGIDADSSAIELSLKHTQPHPWDELARKYKPGDPVAGTVVSIKPYGAFIEIRNGLAGLLHISQIPDFADKKSTQDYFKVGEVYEVKILHIDFDKRKMSFTLK